MTREINLSFYDNCFKHCVLSKVCLHIWKYYYVLKKLRKGIDVCLYRNITLKLLKLQSAEKIYTQKIKLNAILLIWSRSHWKRYDVWTSYLIHLPLPERQGPQGWLLVVASYSLTSKIEMSRLQAPSLFIRFWFPYIDF